MSADRTNHLRGRRDWLRRAGALLPGLLLAGCALDLPGSGDPPQLYTLSPKSSFAPDLPRVDWQLVVATPVAAAGLDTSRIAVQRAPLTLDYYARAAWSDRTPLLVQTLLVESFENSGRIVAVGREAVGLRADYLLKTELREFQAEYAGDGPPQVRVKINAKLVRVPDRQIIAGHTAEALERASGTALHDIAAAFDVALGRCLKGIVEWTLVAPGTTMPPS